MKTNPQYVNGYRAPRYLAKIPRDSLGRRVLWFLFRRYCLNEDYYRVSRKFTGPRPTSAHFTLKANATAYRYYLEPRKRNKYPDRYFCQSCNN